MCLNKITKVYEGEEQKNTVEAYKVFELKQDGTLHRSLHGTTYFENKWMNEKDARYELYKNDEFINQRMEGPQYSFGFHAFKYKKDAEKYIRLYPMFNSVIRKVKLTNLALEGWDNVKGLDAIAIVGKDMFVEPAAIENNDVEEVIRCASEEFNMSRKGIS